MRLLLVVFLGVVTLAGCKTPRMATPADLVPVADEIVVTNRSRATGMLANETFGMGPFPVTRVHRGGTSTSSSGFTLAGVSDQSSSSKAFYDFDMTTPVGVFKGACGLRTYEKVTHIGNWDLGGAGSQILDCNCSGGGPGVPQVFLQLAPDVRGVVVSRGGASAPLQPSSAAEGGGQGFLGMPLGYEAGGTPPLGAVDTVHPGRVWINRALAPGAQADLACLFAGLLLYRPASSAP